MRVLVAIPHHHDPSGGNHGSLVQPADERAARVARTLRALHEVLGRRQAMIDIGERSARPAGRRRSVDLQVVFCTTAGKHLLDDPAVQALPFGRAEVDGDPMNLGFACHRVLRDGMGDHDLLVYLEDDLVVEDPWFLVKLRWFGSLAPENSLLQPQRFEAARGMKVYVDGALAPRVLERFQEVTDPAPLEGRVMGEEVRFERARNPHSGCFFVTPAQLERLLTTDGFLAPTADFVGPLESAATLGIMRAFHVYKAAAEHADFLEIRHQGDGFLRHVETAILRSG